MADDDTIRHDGELDEIEAVLRELGPDDLGLAEPPADLWDGIEAAIAADATAAPSADDGRAPEPADVVSLTQRRARWVAPVLAVAAAAILVVAGVTIVGLRDGGEVLAIAELRFERDFDPLGDGASATAELVERDGDFEIVLADSTLPNELAEAADLELWLIEADAEGNIVDVASVAIVSGEGAYSVPASIDVVTHRIVDISVEPRDGDESHSGRSILRGTLQA